jgi:hypothetical protein
MDHYFYSDERYSCLRVKETSHELISRSKAPRILDLDTNWR